MQKWCKPENNWSAAADIFRQCPPFSISNMYREIALKAGLISVAFFYQLVPSAGWYWSEGGDTPNHTGQRGWALRSFLFGTLP